jgi:membrane protease YdiL (CAAX protease family)
MLVMNDTGGLVREPRPPRVWPVFVTWAAVLVVLQCVGGLALAAALVLADARTPAQAAQRMQELLSTRAAILASAVLTSCTFAGVAGVAGLLAPEGARRRLRLGRGRARAWTTAVMLLAIVALGQVADSAVALLGWAGTGTLGLMARALQHTSGPLLALSLLVLGVMAGAGEELFFRGFIQTRLRQRLGPWPAVALTALAFGITHLDPVHAPLALLMGLFLGWITELTGSVWPAVAVHAANNALWVLMVAWLPHEWPARVHVVLVLALLPVGAALVVLLRHVHAPAAAVPPPPTD